jgi:hypothetical protein
MSHSYKKRCGKIFVIFEALIRQGNERLKEKSVILAEEINFDEMEDVAVLEVWKLQEDDLSIEQFTKLHNEPDIIRKDPLADIHNEDELILHLTKDVLKRIISKIEEVLSEVEDHTFRVEHWSNIAKKNVMNRLMPGADL